VATVTAPAKPPDPNRRVLAEAVPVWVTDDAGEWPGWLTEWARWDAAGWRGYCRWSAGIGRQHLGWPMADQIRPREVE